MAHPALSSALAVALALTVGGATAQGKKAAEKAEKAKAPAAQESRPAKTATDKIGTENFHAQCIGCHGIPGYKTAYPDVYHVPKIAGQNPAYIVAALKAYKSGDRSHPSMRGIAASLSEEQMQKLAEYYGGPAK